MKSVTMRGNSTFRAKLEPPTIILSFQTVAKILFQYNAQLKDQDLKQKHVEEELRGPKMEQKRPKRFK